MTPQATASRAADQARYEAALAEIKADLARLASELEGEVRAISDPRDRLELMLKVRACKHALEA